ncbi:GHKL domain-containing protein [Clostridium fermenticellae]|uniref:GHKL domain-containing protein n=1 Tax=Clostridium fermenticellae TaxID=2068654 RepID=A0A386H1Z5_9CLOT|nr:GHKL domain-containing protein [Clostridium fermenticellae]AYD39712.1 GHKL domain-containing protein [Clostridium fermenticellae]
MGNLVFDLSYTTVIIINFIIIIINISSDGFDKKNLIIFSIINYILIFLLHIAKYDVVIFLSLFLNPALYLYIISKKIYTSIVKAVFINIIFTISNSITVFFSVNIFKVNYDKIITNSDIYFIAGLSTILFSYIISKIIGMIFNKLLIKTDNLDDFIKGNSLIIAYMIVDFIIIISGIIVYNYIFKDIDRITIFLNIIVLLFVLASSVILCYFNNRNIKIKLEQKYKNEEYQQLKQYIDMLESAENSLRRFKHDYLNILQTLENYIKSEDIVGLKQFYKNEILPESNKIINNNKYLYPLKRIKISSLKGLISSKIIIADSKNIEVKLEILDNICDISMGVIDICRIIGVLMDNAIEGTELTDNKKIHIAVIKNECATIFFIKNSCIKDTPKIYEIYQEGFSTKGYNRGIGLKTVRSIIDSKYSNALLNTKIKDLIFTQELVIYD